MQQTLAWLAPIVVFGLVVFVHELGHFLAAKACGVYAPRFSIGFGPALWRKRWGETEYVLAALPLGGYVRMASREDETMALIEGGGEGRRPRHEGAHPGVLSEVAGEVAGESRPADWDPNAMYPFGPKPVPENRWFESKGIAARIFILLAGVTMNFVLALVVSISLLATYGRSVVPTRTVGGVGPRAASAFGDGLRAGDTIVAVAGVAPRNWQDAQRRMLAAPAPLTIATQRGPVTARDSSAPSSAARTSLVASVDYYLAPVIDSVVTRMPAQRAGVRHGDSVVAVNDVRVASFTQLAERISTSPGRPISLGIVRDGQPLTLRVTPESTTVADPATGAPRVQGKIGIAPRQIVLREAIPLGESVRLGARMTLGFAAQIVDVVKQLARRDVSVKQLGGPIAIARTSVAAAREGMEALLYLIAFLSVNVAVLNLLPIPILDGGQIVLNVAERVKGRAFSARTREYILRAGLVAVGLLFVTVMWNDITRFISDVMR